MEPQITNIIFDMGGVLIEWDPEQLVAQFTGDTRLRQILLKDVFGHEDWLEWDRGGITIDELMERAAERTGLPLSEVRRLMDLVADSLRAIQPAEQLLRELKSQGKRLYCLSNMPLEHYHILEGTIDFWPEFDGVVISSMVGLTKPDPAVFQYLLDKYQLDPTTCLFLDDYPLNVDRAQQLGIPAMLFKDAATCRRQLQELLG